VRSAPRLLGARLTQQPPRYLGWLAGAFSFDGSAAGSYALFQNYAAGSSQRVREALRVFVICLVVSKPTPVKSMAWALFVESGRKPTCRPRIAILMAEKSTSQRLPARLSVAAVCDDDAVACHYRRPCIVLTRSVAGSKINATSVTSRLSTLLHRLRYPSLKSEAKDAWSAALAWWQERRPPFT
jgi:hypothetical protein